MSAIQVREMRDYYSLTQQQLADRLGVNRAVVAQWETGRFGSPAYLPRAIQQIGYQVIRERNQPILERYSAPDLDEYRHVLKELGLISEYPNPPIYPDFPMFDTHGNLFYWYKVERGGYFAIGEATKNVDGKWRGYIVPDDADPKPDLRLPTIMEAPY